jgi:hypothetical protein
MFYCTSEICTSVSAHKKKTANKDNVDDVNDESINIKEISKDEYEKRT